MVADPVLDTNELIDLLIQGSTDVPTVTGIQSRVTTRFPEKNVTVVPANPEYLLSGESNYEAEPEKPYITLTSQLITPESVYWQDVVPKASEPSLGWSEVHLMRFDVWGRTPPEAKEISDGLAVILKLLRGDLWSARRVGVKYTGLFDVVGEEGLPVFHHKYLTTEISVFQVKEV